MHPYFRQHLPGR